MEAPRIVCTPIHEGLDSQNITWSLGLLTVTVVLYIYWRFVCALAPNSSPALPPGNDGLPFLGETLLLASEKDNFFRKRRSQFGAVFRTHLFGSPAVRVTGEENVRDVLTKEGRQVRSYYPASVRRLFGENSIVTLTGPKHRLRKRQLIQFLSQDFLQEHTPLFSKLIAEHVEDWKEKEVVDIYPACKSISNQTALRFLLRLEPTPTQIKTIRHLLAVFTDNLFCFPLYLPGTAYYKAYNAKQQLIAIIDELRKSKAGESLDRSTSTEELFELLFVGADNNGTGMFVIANLLARHPEVVDRARAELKRAGVQKTDDDVNATYDDVTLEQLRDLVYIRAIVRECLRLMPPVGGVYRTVTEELSLNGYQIPKGWRVIAGIRETHENDPTIEEPLIFDPDRWLEASTKPSFLTFGTGSRMCPGKLLAENLLQVFVVELVRRGTLQIITDSRITMFPAVKPAEKITMAYS